MSFKQSNSPDSRNASFHTPGFPGTNPATNIAACTALGSALTTTSDSCSRVFHMHAAASRIPTSIAIVPSTSTCCAIRSTRTPTAISVRASRGELETQPDAVARIVQKVNRPKRTKMGFTSPPYSPSGEKKRPRRAFAQTEPFRGQSDCCASCAALKNLEQMKLGHSPHLLDSNLRFGTILWSTRTISKIPPPIKYLEYLCHARLRKILSRPSADSRSLPSRCSSLD